MTFDQQMQELEKLIEAYDQAHGQGKGHEISGSLMSSHGIARQISIFRKAAGRVIVVQPDPDALDAVIIRYKKV